MPKVIDALAYCRTSFGLFRPVQRAGHNADGAPTRPHIAILIDAQFDDRVVPDLAALADSVEPTGFACFC